MKMRGFSLLPCMLLEMAAEGLKIALGRVAVVNEWIETGLKPDVDIHTTNSGGRLAMKYRRYFLLFSHPPYALTGQ